jgi:hypothetical protein
MQYLIGVDNTDNSKSPGTGNLVRRLAESLQVDGAAAPLGITRHQLLADPRVPCTAHNTSVCLSLESENMEGVWETARDFLALEAASGSSVGLCLSRWDSVSRDVMEFGHRAKRDVLTLDEAQQTASKSHVRLGLLTGTGAGVIGALAAVGLHREGDDGRFLWLPGLREMQGSYSVAEIVAQMAIDRICSLDNIAISPEALVDVTDGMRPLLRGNQATLYVEKKKQGWRVLDKDRIKGLSA